MQLFFMSHVLNIFPFCLIKIYNLLAILGKALKAAFKDCFFTPHFGNLEAQSYVPI